MRKSTLSKIEVKQTELEYLKKKGYWIKLTPEKGYLASISVYSISTGDLIYYRQCNGADVIEYVNYIEDFINGGMLNMLNKKGEI